MNTKKLFFNSLIICAAMFLCTDSIQAQGRQDTLTYDTVKVVTGSMGYEFMYQNKKYSYSRIMGVMRSCPEAVSTMLIAQKQNAASNAAGVVAGGCLGWVIGVGVNLGGNDAWGAGLSIGYGSDGLSYGMGGYHNPWAWQDNPTYEPETWNDGGYCQETNNCYTFMQDNKSISQGRRGGINPGDRGDKSLKSFSDITLEKVLKAAISDGKIKIPNFLNKLGFGKRGYSEIYLAVGDNCDYHWYKRDNNGLWSHKRGTDPVINYDASGHLITNPAKANRNYKFEGGCNYNQGILLWIKR